MSPKLVAVIKREYLQQIRTKAFWISTFLIPTIGLGFVFLQVVLSKSMTPKGRIAVVDLSGRLFDPLVAEQVSLSSTESGTPHASEPKAVSGAGAPDEKGDKKKARPVAAKGAARRKMPLVEFVKTDATPETLPEVRRKLNKDVQSDRIKAYIVLDEKTLETGAAEWRAPSVKADIVTRESIASLLSRAATKVRLRDRGVDPALYDAARLSVDLDPHEAREVESGENGRNIGFNLAVSAIFFFLI